MGTLHFSHNWGWNKKTGLSEPVWTSFYLFPKKVSELFRSPNIVLDTQSSILVKLRTFLVDTLHCSPNWVWNKKIGLSEPFWLSFYLFQKKYPRSMRLNFFDHRTLFWTPNRQFLSKGAHFGWARSTLAINGDEIKKLDWANHFIQVFTFFQKKYPNFFDHRTLFWTPNRQF